MGIYWCAKQARYECDVPWGCVFKCPSRRAWIAKHRLSGVLTMYRLDVGAYDWAVERGTFKPQKPHHFTAEFIGLFAGGETHFHYEVGERSGSSEHDVEVDQLA